MYTKEECHRPTYIYNTVADNSKSFKYNLVITKVALPAGFIH